VLFQIEERENYVLLYTFHVPNFETEIPDRPYKHNGVDGSAGGKPLCDASRPENGSS
jgi:hypothetical protein